MSSDQIKKKILHELRAADTELSLGDLVDLVGPNVPGGRNAVKAAVVPLLYQHQITLTAKRKFKIAC